MAGTKVTGHTIFWSCFYPTPISPFIPGRSLEQCKPGYLCQPKRAQPSPWGPSHVAELQTKQQPLSKASLCATGSVTAGAPLGPCGTVYVVGRVNSFPSSLSFTQQQQNATCPVHGNQLEQQCQRYLGHHNLVKKGSTLLSPNTDERLSY